MMNLRVGDADYGLFDPYETRYCYISVGGGSSKQKSKGSNSTGISSQNRSDSFDALNNFISTMWNTTQEFGSRTPRLDLDHRGLMPQQSNLLNSMVSQGMTEQFNKLSGGGAMRGQLSPANTTGLIGSSAEKATLQALPQFLPISQQNSMFNATTDQDNRAKTLGFMAQLAAFLGNAATGGGEGSTSATGSSWNANFGLNPSAGSSGGSGAR
jgi:hypothetical protein